MSSRKTCQEAQPSVEENGFKTDMMMMMMMMIMMMMMMMIQILIYALILEFYVVSKYFNFTAMHITGYYPTPIYRARE